MAPHQLMKLVCFILCTTLCVTTTVNSEMQCRNFKSIISFGDSSSDTGNYLGLSDPNDLAEAAFLPYGKTFFHHPTGRYSDGRLIIDFIAEFLGLPFLPPFYVSQDANFEKGVNFAVGGATALENAAYSNFSLSVQLRSFKDSLPKLYGSRSGYKNVIENALIVMGEFGGNDYKSVIKSFEEFSDMVPLVITTISSAITELIDMGARTFLVPGQYPLGCSVVYLTMFQTSNMEEYDPLTGCLKWLNKFYEYHNEQLQTELNRLRKQNPHVTIIYADYYNALLRLYKEPTKYGFINNTLPACCGLGGTYNFTLNQRCGIDVVECCNDPSKYLAWDSVHMTEAANRLMVEGLLNGPYANPPFDWSCLSSEIKNIGSSDTENSLMDN